MILKISKSREWTASEVADAIKCIKSLRSQMWTELVLSSLQGSHI